MIQFQIDQLNKEINDLSVTRKAALEEIESEENKNEFESKKMKYFKEKVEKCDAQVREHRILIKELMMPNNPPSSK